MTTDFYRLFCWRMNPPNGAQRRQRTESQIPGFLSCKVTLTVMLCLLACDPHAAPEQLGSSEDSVHGQGAEHRFGLHHFTVRLSRPLIRRAQRWPSPPTPARPASLGVPQPQHDFQRECQGEQHCPLLLVLWMQRPKRFGHICGTSRRADGKVFTCDLHNLHTWRRAE